MAASTLHGWSEDSPETAWSDDLFADINWPEDGESPFDEGPSPESGIEDLYQRVLDKIDSNNSVVQSNGTSQEAIAADAHPKGSGGGRFSKEVRSILRTWFNEHKDNPYPTAEEKNELAAKTKLKSSQISLWLVNTRRRYRSRTQRDLRSSALPQTMLQPPMPALPGVSGSTPAPSGVNRPELQRPFEEMNPMDRWKVTPIEHEPAALPVILDTLAAAPPIYFDPYSVQYRHSASRFNSEIESGACLSHNDSYWGHSLASYETGLTSMVTGSTISDSTSFTHPMYNMSYINQAANSATRDRRRRRGNPPKAPKPSGKDRLFQCTFCANCTFATKHDWQRHEKSQHLSLESWTCCLAGGTMETDSGPACVFCGHLNPDTLHLETHSYSACQDKDLEERTFYRKDHFQQHLRLTHECKYRPQMEAWKAEVPIVRSRCGFCNATFTTWSARADHLAAHFKCHATMKDWVGDWGFEPHIAALVERVTPSASKTAHAKLAAPSMPPPPLPFYSLDMTANGGGGVGVSQPLLHKDLLPIQDFDGFLDMAAAMSPSTAVNTGYLDLDDTVVSDWVDFGL